MPRLTHFLACLILVALLAGCGGAQRAASSRIDDDDAQGNASGGLASVPPNEGVEAAFTARSYAPGATATLRLEGRAASVRIAFFRGGSGHDGVMQGLQVTPERGVAGTGALQLRLGAWPSGLYYARVVTPGRGIWDAPFVLRSSRIGTSRIAVVLPTNTWQAYNDQGDDSWYFNSDITHVDLARPYIDAGVPPHYRGYDRGFIRWLALEHVRADFFSDDDLDRLTGEQLARSYSLVVFSGHEEYVTAHEFDTTERYRDLGGNLAFLSANDFFYKVEKSGNTMVGRWRWRDLGRPEASLVGEQYVDWNHGRYANKPFRVVGTKKTPWLFNNTGLADGARFGVYGIEVDATASASPPRTQVLAVIPNIFGVGETAEMTYYSTQAGAKVFSAGVMNFGGSALWPQVRTMIRNLITYLQQP
jgi:hypothetical protein